MLQAVGMMRIQRQEGKLTVHGWRALRGTQRQQVQQGKMGAKSIPGRKKGGTGCVWAPEPRAKVQRQRIRAEEDGFLRCQGQHEVRGLRARNKLGTLGGDG